MYIRYTHDDRQIKLCQNHYELGYSFGGDETTVDDVISHWRGNYQNDAFAVIDTKEQFDELWTWFGCNKEGVAQ